MNELEIKLTLWAIFAILLFEILVIICLCRCCCTRTRPKKFYLKQEEYEYLENINSNSQTKFQSTILRPPHADELALVGTIRGPHPIATYNSGVQNLGFYSNNEDKRMPPVLSSSSSSSSSSSALSQHWQDFKLPIIHTAQLPPADYKIYSYSNDHYSSRHSNLPRPTLVNFHQYREQYVDDDNVNDNDNDQFENYRFQTVRRPKVHLVDTSTEFYGMNYKTIVPKSILKSSTSITPPTDFLPSPYSQTQPTLVSSNYDESPEISIRFTAHRSIPVNYSTNDNNKLSTESTQSLITKSQMKFASVNELNDVEWEVPREFQTIIQENETYDSTHERILSTTVDSRKFITQRQEMNAFRAHYSSKGDITQQKAFEY